MLLSRVADSLYWISRYLERAEHTARLMDVRLDLGLDADHAERFLVPAQPQRHAPVQAGRGDRARRAVGGRDDREPVAQSAHLAADLVSAQIERAAAAGKHVMMEKPFTLDRRSAARALDRALSVVMIEIVLWVGGSGSRVS